MEIPPDTAKFFATPPSSGFDSVGQVGSAVTEQVDDAVMNLALALSQRHGEVYLAREESGMHIYMASPICLDRDGEIELQKRHLAVNAEKFLGLGRYKVRTGNYNNDRCGYCMKTETPYNVTELLRMLPLEQRGIRPTVARVKVGRTVRRLVPDGKGNMIPEGPGQIQPLTSLSPGHPAYDYLVDRQYDLASLERQLRACFCYEEFPQDRSIGRCYRRLPLDMYDTAQGRIVFFCDVDGVQVGWQARVIERKVGDIREIIHPYRRVWTPVEKWDPLREKFIPLPEVASSPYDWELSKYRTSPGAQRNSLVMGLDAALAWNRERNITSPLAVLVEGPLDAGRIGPPAVALLGKFISEAQADLLARYFRRVVFVPDNDKAGKKALKRAGTLLPSRVQFDFVELPSHHKDIGDVVDEAEREQILGPFLRV